MKRFVFFWLLPIIAVVLSSCDNDDDQLDPKLIKGTWEMAADDDSEYTAIYTFETAKGLNNYGTVEVMIMPENGSIADGMTTRRYDWHASGPQNNGGILDITLTPADAATDDSFSYEIYVITRLTSSKMDWKGSEPSEIKGKSVKFMRRSDK